MNSTVTTVRPPNDFGLFVDGYVTTTTMVAALIAIPANVWTIYSVIRWKRFHLNRNVIWLGIGVSNVLLVLFDVTLVTAFYLRSAPARAALAYTSWVSEVSLVTQTVLSLANRYVQLRHSDFYRRHVTVTRIVAIQLTAFTVVAVSVKWNVLLDSAVSHDLREMINSKLAGSVVVAALIGCALAYPLLPGNVHSAIEDGPVVYRPALRETSFTCSAEETATSTADTGHRTDQDESPSSFVLINDQRVSRLDLESARHFTVMGTASFAFAIPAFVVFFLLDHCLRGDGIRAPADRYDGCRLPGAMYLYARAFYLATHCVFNPLFFAHHRTDKIGIPRRRVNAIEHYA